MEQALTARLQAAASTGAAAEVADLIKQGADVCYQVCLRLHLLLFRALQPESCCASG